MPLPNTQARSGYLRPDSGGTGIDQPNLQGMDPLSRQLVNLTNILDPYGDGPTARYLKEQEAAARRVAEMEFQREDAIDEAAIIQKYPQLRGAGKIIHRHLDGLRGDAYGRTFADQVLIEYNRRGLKGSDPEEVEAFLDEQQSIGLNLGSNLGQDGQESFLSNFSAFRRELTSNALTDRIKYINDQHVAQEGVTAASVIEDTLSKGDTERLAVEFSEKRDVGRLFGLDKTEANEAWINSMGTYVAANPSAGGDGYRALLAAETIDEEAAANGELVKVKAITDPKVRQALSASAAEADRRAALDASVSYKEIDRKLKEEKLGAKAEIASLVRSGATRDEIRQKSEGIVSKLDPMNQAEVTDYVITSLKNRADYAEISYTDMARYRQEVFQGQLDLDGIARLNLNEEQNRQLVADYDDFRKGHGVQSTPSFRAKYADFEKLKVTSDIFGLGANYERNDYVIRQRDRFVQEAIGLAANDPRVLVDEGRAREVLGQLYEDMAADIEKFYPRSGQTKRSPEPSEVLSIEEARARYQEQVRGEYEYSRQKAVESGYIEERRDPTVESLTVPEADDYLREFDAAAGVE